ncbi:tyrosine-protein phosphatase [Nonomuraea sp. NBC_01738]|uniref:tyrosine-protein phosphatase n=1 Tax=Nonomuraea sp. NBC_01738 TaxID=2976003 RepID=UPI002E0D968B|nr:tyrosine-protein phosphatase [Nonomuraea sp. NBC_01738]
MGDVLGITSAPNLRDLGGQHTGDGRKVRTGIGFRAGALDRLSDSEQSALVAGGLRLVCDLRTATERGDQPDRLPDSVTYLVCDVQRGGGHGADIAALFTSREAVEALRSPEVAQGFLVEVYRAFVTTTDAHDAYRDMLRALATPGTLIHCTAGKDRTGWGAALLLTLLGVDRATVTADYLASNEHLAAAAETIYVMADQHGIERELVRPLLEVREVYLDAAFAAAEELYGGIPGYVRQALGLTDTDLDALRTLYLT